jgi:hypothetical protein
MSQRRPPPKKNAPAARGRKLGRGRDASHEKRTDKPKCQSDDQNVLVKELWREDELMPAREPWRFTHFMQWYERRAHRAELALLWQEVRRFARLRPGVPVKVRRMLNHLAYLASKQGVRYPITHDATAFLSRLLRSWGVPVKVRPSHADKVPLTWYQTQACPDELKDLAATAARQETPDLPGIL